MTVSTEISSNEYTGNGVTTDFDYKFRIFKESDLSVITSDADGDNVVTLRLGTDYTVIGANKSAGGKVILTKPLANGHKISIARDIPITQETSFRNQSKFFAETHEDAFDYLTMIVQRIWGSLGSLYLKRPNILANWFDAKGYRIANLGKPKRDSDAVDLGTLNDEISGVNGTILKREKRFLRVDDMDIAALPKASGRAGNVLTFDKDGKPIVVAPASGSAVDVLNKLSDVHGAGLVQWRNHSVGEILDRAVYSSDFSTLEEFAKFPAGKKVLEAGVYTINSPLVFNDDVINDFSTSGKVIINCTEPMIALTVGSEYTDNLGKINKVDAGSSIITLKANPSFEIKSGNILFIHNPVDFSFSPHRSYYRQGESVTVKSVSGTSITLAGAIFDSYPDDCVLIKPLFRKLKVSGDIEVNFPVETGEHSYSAASLGLLLSQLRDTDTSGLKVKATQGAYAIIARHCVNTSGVSMVGMQRLTDGFTTHGLDYGINLANCQNVNFKGLFIGERHGATTSGSGYIVNRFCNIEGEIKTTGLGLQPAADWHGNTEFCSYGGYLQGLIFGGDNNTVKSGTVVDGYAIGSNSPVMIGAELLGLNFDFSGITINSYDLPHVRSYGVVDVGGATNAISDNTRRGGKIKLDYSIINGLKAEQAIKIRNRGSGKDYSFSGVGMKINTLTGKRPVWLSAISGSEFKNTTVNGASFPDNSEIILVVREGRVGVDKYGKFEATIASGQSETTVTVETMLGLTIGSPLFSNVVVDNVKSGQTNFSFIASVISSTPKNIRVKIKSAAGGNVTSDSLIELSYMLVF